MTMSQIRGAFEALDAFDRVPLLGSATPLTELRLPSVEERRIRLFVKREDLVDRGGGGNKLRKLEYILAKARAEGADTLITFGALQSNHARLTAAAAARLGMDCHLVLSPRVPNTAPAYLENGNILLSSLFGAQLHIAGPSDDPVDLASDIQDHLLARGRKGFVVPFGGSDLYGALGMARAGVELLEDMYCLGHFPDSVVVASGSGGTQAGLIAGMQLASPATRVVGVSVLHDSGTLQRIVSDLLVQTQQALNLKHSPELVVTDEDFVGPGYGQPYPALLDRIAQVARAESLILDPVYTGKAFHGLLTRIERGLHDEDKVIVFVHTGGIPGVFAYAESFASHFRTKTAEHHVPSTR